MEVLLERPTVNWKPFHFDTNQVWGYIDSKQEWLRVKNIYCEAYPTTDPYDCKSVSGTSSFGQRLEHQNPYTLRDFFHDNDMSIV